MRLSKGKKGTSAGTTASATAVISIGTTNAQRTLSRRNPYDLDKYDSPVKRPNQSSTLPDGARGGCGEDQTHRSRADTKPTWDVACRAAPAPSLSPAAASRLVVSLTRGGRPTGRPGGGPAVLSETVKTGLGPGPVGRSFTDAASRRWKHDPDGRLVEPAGSAEHARTIGTRGSPAGWSGSTTSDPFTRASRVRGPGPG
jgi:hypothetical protein